MSDELDDDDLDNEGDSHLVKDLRRQLRAIKKERDDLAEVATAFKVEQRKSTVTKALEARGANPKLARFYDGEDSSAEAVSAWIDENAELFGIPEQESDEDAETERAAARVSQATSQARPKAPGNSMQDLDSRLRSATTPDELASVLAELEKVRV